MPSVLDPPECQQKAIAQQASGGAPSEACPAAPSVLTPDGLIVLEAPMLPPIDPVARERVTPSVAGGQSR